MHFLCHLHSSTLRKKKIVLCTASVLFFSLSSCTTLSYSSALLCFSLFLPFSSPLHFTSVLCHHICVYVSVVFLLLLLSSLFAVPCRVPNRLLDFAGCIISYSRLLVSALSLGCFVCSGPLFFLSVVTSATASHTSLQNIRPGRHPHPQTDPKQIIHSLIHTYALKHRTSLSAFYGPLCDRYRTRRTQTHTQRRNRTRAAAVRTSPACSSQNSLLYFSELN